MLSGSIRALRRAGTIEAIAAVSATTRATVTNARVSLGRFAAGSRRAPTARRSLSTAEPLCTRARRRGQLRQRRVRSRRTFRAARHTVGAAPGSPSLALPSSSCCRAQARDPARVLVYERLKQEKPDRDPYG